MRILITVKEAFERCDIIDFCNVAGIDPEKLSIIPDNYEISLTEKEASDLGLIHLE